MPLTLAALWLRYLPRHDLVGSGLHIVCLVIISIVGVFSYRLAIKTLSGTRLPDGKYGLKPGYLSPGAALLAMAVIIPPLVTFGAIVTPVELRPHSADPRSWIPPLLMAAGWSPYADFRHQEISTSVWFSPTPMKSG